MKKEDPDYGFYVIFHGALAFHDSLDGNVVDVYMPEVAPHVYRAGSWLSEYDIRGPRQLLTLTGIDTIIPGRDSMRGHENVITIKAPVAPGANYRAKLRFPRPHKVFYCRKVMANVAIGFQPASGVLWAQVPVFAYKSDGKEVALTGRDFFWTPKPGEQQVEEPVPITLHVWATAERCGDDDGPALAAELFGERIYFPPYQKSLPSVDEIPDLNDDEIPDLNGRTYELYLLFYERMAWMMDFSAKLRGLKLAPEFTPGTKSSHTTCGPVGGG
jgi:hypothetical protein